MFVTNKLACCGRRGKGCDGLLYWLLYANSWVFPYLFMLLYQLCIWLDWGNKLAAGIKYDWSPAFKDRLIWIHQAIAIYQYLLAIMTMLLFLWISVGRMYHFPRWNKGIRDKQFVSVSVVFRKVTKECSRIASHLPSKHSYMVITTYIATECGMPICDDDSIQDNG